MSTKRQRNLWRAGFLLVTAGALIMELVAAFDRNQHTDPWTELIVGYVPWEVSLAIFGALVLWVPLHFIVRYQRFAKAKAPLRQEDLDHWLREYETLDTKELLRIQYEQYSTKAQRVAAGSIVALRNDASRKAGPDENPDQGKPF